MIYLLTAKRGAGADLLKSKAVRRRTKKWIEKEKEAARLKEEQFESLQIENAQLKVRE